MAGGIVAPQDVPATGGEVRHPRFVTEWDLCEALPGVPSAHPSGVAYAGVYLLVRLATEPLGVLELDTATPAAVAAACWATFRTSVVSRYTDAGWPAPEELTPAGLRTPGEVRQLPWLREREEVLRKAPPISVVMCTRGRPEQLRQALAGVTDLAYPGYEVVVVDNAPTDESNREVVASSDWPTPVRYFVESRPGLSWARNAGARAAEAEVICFLDDDETPDRHWIAEYARALHRHPTAAVASGLILPRHLDTIAEQAFEQLGGHSKGRGFADVVFDTASHARQHPLYPRPPFGAGGNMAFKASALRAIGYFDVALGAGTPTRGSEDTAAIAQAMLAGMSVVWHPSALVWHSHYPTFDGARRQLTGYALGLASFYTKMLREDPRRLGRLVTLFPRALTDTLLPTTVSADADPALAQLQHGMAAAQVKAMLSGPAAYARSRAAQRAISGGDHAR